MKSVSKRLYLAGTLSLLAFGLVLLFNETTIFLSFAALFLAVSYPFTKRFLAIPQAYLGVTFGFGIPMAFAAVNNSIPLVAWVLLAANVFWVIAYDTQYAMVDREDYLKIGIKSSAIFFGQFDVRAVMACYFLMMSLLIYIGYFMSYKHYYYISLGVASVLIFRQYELIRLRTRVNCFKSFQQNNWIGLTIFVGILMDYWFSV